MGGAPRHETRPGVPADSAAAKLEAELAALRGMAGVFAHDLSNPLQSLTVLLELTLDEAAAGSGGWDRVGQSLEAAKAMHSLVHDFVRLMRPQHHAGIETDFGAILERCLGMFRRRFERQNIRVRRDLMALATAPPAPPEFVWAFLNLVLGIVNCCMTPGYSAYELDLSARAGHGHELVLSVELRGRARSADALALTLPRDAVRLAHQALLDTAVDCEGLGAASARFRIQASDETRCST